MEVPTMVMSLSPRTTGTCLPDGPGNLGPALAEMCQGNSDYLSRAAAGAMLSARYVELCSVEHSTDSTGDIKFVFRVRQ